MTWYELSERSGMKVEGSFAFDSGFQHSLSTTLKRSAHVNMKSHGRDDCGRGECILTEHETHMFSLEASSVSLT